jgi:fructose-1,6-bisphosphatase/inositol monophosphatase family enzyme
VIDTGARATADDIGITGHEDGRAMKFTQDDVAGIGDVMAHAARTEIMPRFKALSDVRMKANVFDPVTEADEAAERVISGALRATWPGALIVGEEAAAADPGLTGRIAAAELAFTVDPIDGTRNFVAGLPLFGVMVAAMVRGEIVAGLIHDPVCQDTAWAIKGQGAWLSRPAAEPLRLQVAEPGPLERMDSVVGAHYLPEPLRAQVRARQSRLGLTYWLRCSAHEYRMAAMGRCHVLFISRLMPWDHAAGWLLHQEAGGYSARFDGTPYTPTETAGGLIVAPDRASWQAVRDALLG